MAPYAHDWQSADLQQIGDDALGYYHECKDEISLAITRTTCVADQVPVPRAVGMPRSLRAVAMAHSDVAPAACNLVVGTMSGLARWSVSYATGAADQVTSA